VGDYVLEVADVFVKRHVLPVFYSRARGIICAEEDHQETDVGGGWRRNNVREDFQRLPGGVAAVWLGWDDLLGLQMYLKPRLMTSNRRMYAGLN
jgi:hypothetical protein